MSEKWEHPLRMAKDLGLILLDGSGSSKTYTTLSYEGLLDLAEKAYWLRRSTPARMAS